MTKEFGTGTTASVPQNSGFGSVGDSPLSAHCGRWLGRRTEVFQTSTCPGKCPLKLSIIGLATAAVIAPAAAMAFSFILLWLFDTLPYVVGMADASAATKQLMGYSSLQAELISSLGRLLYDVFLGPFLAVPLGFVGAAIFLAPPLAIASLKDDVRSYMIAGGVAGASHAVAGTLLARFSLDAGWLWLVLGMLPYWGRPIAIVTTAIGAVVAGLLVGWLYGRIVGGRRA